MLDTTRAVCYNHAGGYAMSKKSKEKIDALGKLDPRANRSLVYGK